MTGATAGTGGTAATDTGGGTRPGGVAAGTFTLTVGGLFDKQVRLHPERVAVEHDGRVWTYRELGERVDRWVRRLRADGVRRGRRVAVLSENRPEYLELELAAARLGAIVAGLNWRLADDELLHCITLTEPAVLVASPRYAGTARRLPHGVPTVHILTSDTTTAQPDAQVPHDPAALLGTTRPIDPADPVDASRPIDPADPVDTPGAQEASGLVTTPDQEVEAEDGLVILYTSGTTGLPKGAVVSHRAMLARMTLFVQLTGAVPDDAFVAWAPMFHMVSTDHALATLLLGGRVVIIDGLDLPAILAATSRHRLSWLVAMPGMIDRLIDALRGASTGVRGVRVVGAMADLVPTHQLRDLTALLGAPYLNTFGSTECGLAPACAAVLEPGVAPTRLSKRESPLCLVRLVDPDDRDVPDGTPGELIVRGPSVFSGYWNADATNRADFRGGWFHTGDLFVRHDDGTLDFVDRVKYMIKTGGENVYPAEIERHLLAHPDVVEAAVVRRADERWGEVPVAFVALGDGAAVTAEGLRDGLRGVLSSYKLPASVHVIAEPEFPRSATGKVQRHELEARLDRGPSSG